MIRFPIELMRKRCFAAFCAALCVLASPQAGIGAGQSPNLSDLPQVTIRPRGIVIHHSALSLADMLQFPGPTDAKVIDSLHADRGFGVVCGGRLYHIGYHYVILPSGEIQAGRPETCIGAHAPGYNDLIGICLIGNFSTTANPDGRLGDKLPTQMQLDSLLLLINKLKKKYEIPCSNIKRHLDLKPGTLCPGDRLRWSDIQKSIGCGMMS